MELLKYFLECAFNEDEDFEKLDYIIDRFKVRERPNNVQELINDLYQIISTKNYLLANNMIQEYGNRDLDDAKEVEKFINYLYDKLLDRSTNVKATDFIKECKVIPCPVCTPDPRVVMEFGIIDKATVIANNIQIYVCKPCTLVWVDEDDIRVDNALGYKEFMKANGLKGFWDELKDIDVL